MAAGAKLDNIGTIKMQTLEDGLVLLQRINGLVEQYGMAVKSNQPTGQWLATIRRTLPTLAANLKGQFGMISDLVVAMNLASSRGANEAVRLRALREGVAQVKQAIEIGLTQTKAKHTVKGESPSPAGGSDAT